MGEGYHRNSRDTRGPASAAQNACREPMKILESGINVGTTTFPHAFLAAKAGLLAAARSAPTETTTFPRPRHCRDHGIPAIPNNAGDRRSHDIPPCVFGGEGGLARPRSQRPYRDHDIAATHGIAATPALPTPPIWRNSGIAATHGIAAIPINAGGRRGAASAAARASPSSEAVETFPHAFWRRGRACSPPLAAPLQRPRYSRDPRHCRDHGIAAIPINAGGRRGAASAAARASPSSEAVETFPMRFWWRRR